MRRSLTLVLILAAALAVAACGRSDRAEAPIHGVALSVQGLDSPQYVLEVTYGLPDACHTLDRADLKRSGTEIEVSVTNQVIAGDTACAEIYRSETHAFALGGDFEIGATYAVRANDWKTSFTVADIEVEAPVRDVTLRPDEYQPRHYVAEIISSRPTSCHSLDRVETWPFFESMGSGELAVRVVNRIGATGAACVERGDATTTLLSLANRLRPGWTYNTRANDWNTTFTTAARSADGAATTEIAAPIKNVNLRIGDPRYDPLRTVDPPYFLEILSDLPDACHAFERLETRRSGTDILVEVTNRMVTGDLQCGEIYGTSTHFVNLGHDFELGATYIVKVNDWRTSFTVVAEATEVEAPIKDVTVGGTNGYYLVVTSGLGTTCEFLDRTEAQRSEGKITVIPVNRVFASGAACAESSETRTSTAGLGRLNEGDTFTLEYNGVSYTTPRYPNPSGGEILAYVEDATIHADASAPNRYVLKITHLAINPGHFGCQTLDRIDHELLEPPWDQRTFRVSVVNRITEGGGDCSDSNVPTTSIVEIPYEIEPGARYTFLVNYNRPLLFTKVSQPIPEDYALLPHAPWPSYASPAGILELTVRTTEFQARRYFLDFRVEYVPACGRMERMDLRRSGNDLYVRPVVRLGYDALLYLCDLPASDRFTMDLGADFEPGVTYTVYSEGRVLTEFTAQ